MMATALPRLVRFFSSSEQLFGVGVGLLPELGHCGEFVGDGAAAARNAGAVDVAAVGDGAQQGVELLAAALEFAEGSGVTLKGELAGFGKLLGEGAHLARCGDVGGAEAADPDLVKHQGDGQGREDQEGDAQQA
jgi:hypothetical protein